MNSIIPMLVSSINNDNPGSNINNAMPLESEQDKVLLSSWIKGLLATMYVYRWVRAIAKQCLMVCNSTGPGR